MDLLQAFGIGFICTVLASAPIGPVSFAVIQTTMTSGRRAGYLIAFGGIFADLTFATVAWFIADLIIENQDPVVFAWLNVATIPVVVFLGVKMILDRKKEGEVKIRAGNNFLIGVALGVSNPGLLFWWLTALTYSTSGGYLGQTNLELVPFLIGGALGGSAAVSAVIYTTARLSKNASARFRSGFSLVLGTGFLAFGAFLAGRAVVVYLL